MSDDHSDRKPINVVHQSQFSKASKPTFGQKLKVHLRRWWWIYLILLVSIVLIIVLPIIYVAIPNIIQDQVNKSTLTIEGQTVTDPQPHSIMLSINSTARSDSSYDPNIDAFNGTLVLRDGDQTPFAYLAIPATKVVHEIPVNITQRLEIADMDRFIAYNKLVLNSEEFSYGIVGRPEVHLSVLPSNEVNYNQTITQKGLNGFKGFELRDYSVSLKPENDGTTLRGTAFIPNPSVLTVDFGSITFNVSVAGTHIGQAFIDNLVLRPGDNEIPTTAATDNDVVVGLIGDYPDLKLPVDIVGVSIVNSAGQHLEYYEEAIAGTILHTTLDVSQALGTSRRARSS